MITYFVSYLVINTLLALGITALFATSGSVLMKAIVRCSTEVPIATVRILSLVYGTLALGRVFLELNIPGRIDDAGQILVRLSDATGGNLTFFSLMAGVGVVLLMAVARPTINLLIEMDQRQEERRFDVV